MNSEGNGPRSQIVIIAGKNLVIMTHSCIVTLLWDLICTKVTFNCIINILLLCITFFNAETECESEPRKYYALFLCSTKF